MNLRNITVPKKEVPVDGEQKFTVGGVSANQAFTLYQRHRGDLGQIFDNLSGRAKVDVGDVLSSVEGIIMSFPLLIAEVIALASGENPFDEPNFTGTVAIATNLPLPVQVDALMKIAELTFSTDMPPKKFFGLLVALIQQATEPQITPSEIG